MMAAAAVAAVSMRRMCGANCQGLKFAFSAWSNSWSVKPPSGPMMTMMLCGAGMLVGREKGWGL